MDIYPCLPEVEYKTMDIAAELCGILELVRSQFDWYIPEFDFGYDLQPSIKQTLLIPFGYADTLLELDFELDSLPDTFPECLLGDVEVRTIELEARGCSFSRSLVRVLHDAMGLCPLGDAGRMVPRPSAVRSARHDVRDQHSIGLLLQPQCQTSSTPPTLPIQEH